MRRKLSLGDAPPPRVLPSRGDNYVLTKEGLMHMFNSSDERARRRMLRRSSTKPSPEKPIYQQLREQEYG